MAGQSPPGQPAAPGEARLCSRGLPSTLQKRPTAERILLWQKQKGVSPAPPPQALGGRLSPASLIVPPSAPRHTLLRAFNYSDPERLPVNYLPLCAVPRRVTMPGRLACGVGLEAMVWCGGEVLVMW
ncbi:hypothetical protein E2C01_087519 [Portunus trituberculatus]|uniref:Uncharacterized protein n=1 Tax=Portunus trituberculatus TaxID=210409 RepID=A0A5B7J6S9_PORTR|nr:hypothetical protein [Portunus trituberculatus]